MATFEFEFDDVVDYVRDVKRAQDKAERKEIYKFLRKEGSKLRRKTISEAWKSGIQEGDRKNNGGRYSAGRGHTLSNGKTVYRKEQNHYHDSITRGKAYLFGGVPSIRVYSSSPHAHLLEHGHRKIGHEPKKRSLGGTTRAFKVFEKAQNAFENQYYADCKAFYEGGFKGLWS